MGPRRNAIHDKTFQIMRRFGDSYELVCDADDFTVIAGAFDGAIRSYSSSTLVLKQGGRIIRTVQTGLYDHKTDRIAVVSDLS